MPFWDNMLAGVGQGVAQGVNNYLEGDLKQKAEARAQAQFDTQQKQAMMTIAKEQRAMDAQTFGAAQDAQVSDLRAAAAGDEAAGKRAAQRFPTIAQYRNKAFGLNDPIPAAPVGAPIYGTGAPAVPAQPARTLDQQGPTETGAPLGQISTMPTIAQPAQAPQTSFTTDKTLAYLKGGLYLPPAAPQKLNPGDSVVTLDPITNKPTASYTAPESASKLAAIQNAQDKIEFLYKKLESDTATAQEKLRAASELATAKGELERAKMDLKENGYADRNDQRAAELRQKWGHDLASFVSQGRAQFMRDNTYVDEDKVKHPPKAADVAAEEARLEAYYRKNNPEPTATIATPTGGGPTTLPKNPNPTRSLSTPGQPSGRNPFVSQAPNIEVGLMPQMQVAYNPSSAALPKVGGVAHWAPYVTAASQQTGVPEQILEAVMRQESGGNAGAKSPVGALGLMQLMPDTARGLGVNPRDPYQNILGGARYLRQMYDKFGSWESALAAYNAGPGALAPSRQNANYQIWQAPYNKGYAETRNYVKSIKADLRRMQMQGQHAALPDEMTDKMAEFYARHGIQPGAADA
jgi:soluble lytic murein transglycosylase-like protein